MWLEKGQHGINLRNHSTGEVLVDKLFQEHSNEGPCNESRACIGSRMTPRQVSSNYKRSKDKVLQQAKEFLDEYFRSLNKFGSEEHVTRLLQVHKEIDKQGNYDLTFEELEFGVRLAWRNAPRCIARIQWTTLKLFDCRHVETAQQMFESILEHVVYATNGGRIRSAITLFPPRRQGQKDFRIWNSQLISYACYRNSDGSIMGDAANIDFTELCLSLGWKKDKRTQFDILPMVLQANGLPPEVFDYPEDVVLRIPLVHPTIPSFDELGLQWYVLPAVANMLFDCGGIQFPAAPFNGWYMSTEIGARDICDAQRYNLSEEIAKKLQLDTNTNATLWRDTVILETTKAVLHSYQTKGVTLWDHHTASESFMQFYTNEMKTRGGCPADWIWLVPPMSSSSSPLFHQEMAFYFLKPSYEYQVPAYVEYKKSAKDNKRRNVMDITEVSSKTRLRSAMIAVRFCVNLYLSSLSKRPKLVVLYASQSGKAEKYANTIFKKLNPFYQAQIYCMADYETSNLKYQQVIIAVASTFGEGEPPTNGESFKKNLQEMQKTKNKISLNGISPKFVVLALGSKAYPKFCSFGKYLDIALGELGGQRLLPLECADELDNQEKTYEKWESSVMFGLIKKEKPPKPITKRVETVEKQKVANDTFSPSARFIMATEKEDLIDGLSHVHRNQIYTAKVVAKTFIGNPTLRNAVFLVMNTNKNENLDYQPGDHVVIVPRNDKDLVRRFVNRLKSCPEFHSIIQLQVQGPNNNWEYYKRIPSCSFESLLVNFIDLTCPPNQSTLQLLATFATDLKSKAKLDELAQNSGIYKDWVSRTCSNIVEVLEDFPDVDVDAALLIGTLSIIQPRYYSISSSSSVFPNEIHVTASLVRYTTQDGLGRIRRGLCTSYMEGLNRGDMVMCFTRPTPSFRLPFSPSKPLIWIASGSGIAPFRGFWQQRCHDKGVLVQTGMLNKISSRLLDWKRTQQVGVQQQGSIFMYYGCRGKASQLFRNEVDAMVQNKIISKSFVAYSRENDQSKVYVQDLLWKDGARVSNLILKEEAYVYVCGGSTMVSQVEETLKRIILHYGNMNLVHATIVTTKMKVEGRYRTDMFGINMNN